MAVSQNGFGILLSFPFIRKPILWWKWQENVSFIFIFYRRAVTKQDHMMHIYGIMQTPRCDAAIAKSTVLIDEENKSWSQLLTFGHFTQMFKGTVSRDFRLLVFFHESVSPKPLSIPLGPFRIFSKIRGDIRSSTWSCEYLREISKKFKTVLMVKSGLGGNWFM